LVAGAGRPGAVLQCSQTPQPATQFLNSSFLCPEPLTEKTALPAVVLADAPSEDEATWLLALAILQVAGYNPLETVWTN
jgi:hypothetical protein